MQWNGVMVSHSGIQSQQLNQSSCNQCHNASAQYCQLIGKNMQFYTNIYLPQKHTRQGHRSSPHTQ